MGYYVMGRQRDDAPVTIRGVEYRSAAAAAEALGVSRKEVIRNKREGSLDKVGLTKQAQARLAAMFPVTIRGETFDTLEAVAARFGVTVKAVKNAVSQGRAEYIGLPPAKTRKRHGVEPLPVRVAGQVFPSVREAAKALRVTQSAVRTAIARGSEDFVGTGRARLPNRSGQPTHNSKAVTIGRLSFASIRSAAKELGVTRQRLTRKIEAGDKEWLAARSLSVIARRERAAREAREAAKEQAILDAESEVKGRKIPKLRGRVTPKDLEDEARAIALHAARAAGDRARK